MKIIGNYPLTVLCSGIIFLLSFYYSASFAEDNTIEKQPQDQKVTERYDEIKKKQNKDYKTGAYDDNKKDYVKKWISDDINYHKRVIKLKNDYLTWAKDRVSNNNEVIFYKYEPLKDISDAEKKILLEYHNSLFKSKKDKKVNMKKKVLVDRNKNIAPIKSTDKKDAVVEQKDIAKTDNSIIKKEEYTVSNNIYVLYGIISIVIIVFVFIFFKKRNFKYKQ